MRRLTAGNTLCLRYGIRLVNDGRPLAYAILRDFATAPLNEPIAPRQGTPPENRTIELNASELNEVSDEKTLERIPELSTSDFILDEGSGGKKLPFAASGDVEISTGDILFTQEQRPRRATPPPPPVARRKATLPPPRGRPPTGKQPKVAPEEIPKETAEALDMLHEMARRKRPDGLNDSVVASLEHLRGIERERVAKEGQFSPKIKKPEPVAEAQKKKEDSLDISLRELREMDGFGEPDGGALKIPAEISEPVIDLSDADIVEGSASIQVRLGISWESGHIQVQVSGAELEGCMNAMPNDRELMWILPVPPLSTKDDGEIEVLKKFAKEQTATINGRRYYIFRSEGYAGAGEVTRLGNTIHAWPSAATEYSFVGEISEEMQLMSGQWTVDLKRHLLSEQELKEYAHLLPEKRAIWLHPVPESATQVKLERQIIEECTKNKTPTVILGGREYYLFGIQDVPGWKNTVFFFHKTRFAIREGPRLIAWPEHENGRAMLSEEHGFALHLVKHGAPLLPAATRVEPHPQEVENIWQIFGKGKKWLYPLPERLDTMDAGRLKFLIDVSNEEIQRTGMSPLISVQGRWYVALRYGHPDARPAQFRNGMLEIHSQSSAESENLRVKMEGKKIKRILIPKGGAQRKMLYDMFPEGEVRYLLYCGNVSDLGQGTRQITLMNGKESDSFEVLDKPALFSIAVKRENDIIYPL